MPSHFSDEQVINQNVVLSSGRVRAAASSLKIEIPSFKYDIGGQRGAFVGAVNQAVADDDTNYVYLDESGALQINTTGFPSLSHLALARVVASSGEVVAIHEERAMMVASSSSIGLCRIGYPIDAGIRGGTTSASANNEVGAVRFDSGGDGWNRWNFRPPQNYTSGDLVLRFWFSFASSTGPNKGLRWRTEWSCRGAGDALGASYSWIDEQTIDVSSLTIDTLYYFDITIPSAEFNKSKDWVFSKVSRIGTNGADDVGEHLYVHAFELRYTGRQLAGQSGQ